MAKDLVPYIQEATTPREYKEITWRIVAKHYTGFLSQAQITYWVTRLVWVGFSHDAVFDGIIDVWIFAHEQCRCEYNG